MAGMRDICSAGARLHDFSALHYDQLDVTSYLARPNGQRRSSQLCRCAKAPPSNPDDLAARRQVVRSGPSEPPRPQALRLLESGLRPTVQDRYSIAVLNVLSIRSIRSCPLPSRRSMRRASPLERSSATAPSRAIVDRLAELESELAEHRLARKSSSLGWLFGSARAGRADQGPLHLRRRRPRQDHADGPVLRGVAGRAQASRAFPRIHGRRARARPRTIGSRLKRGEVSGEDPIAAAAAAIARGGAGCSASTNSTSPTLPMP